MRERAVLIGGTLRLAPGANGGTRVTLELPPV
jgi:signal transduction histidine kinase